MLQVQGKYRFLFQRVLACGPRRGAPEAFRLPDIADGFAAAAMPFLTGLGSPSSFGLLSRTEEYTDHLDLYWVDEGDASGATGRPGRAKRACLAFVGKSDCQGSLRNDSYDSEDSSGFEDLHHRII